MPKRPTKNRMQKKPGSRYDRYEGGAVPQNNRTSREQLEYLDIKGFTATKERAKLAKRIVKESRKTK